MNKTILVLLLAFGYAWSQEQNDSDLVSFDGDSMKKSKSVFYGGLQGNAISGWNLNNNLAAAGFAEIPDQALEFVFGVKFTGEQYTFDAEFGFMGNNKQNNNFRTNLLSAPVRLKFGRLLFNQPGFHLTAGVVGGMYFNEVEAFEKNQSVDFNDLGASALPTKLTLRNNLLVAGPVIGFGFGKQAQKSIRFYVSYEHGLTRGRWKSDYANVLNTVQEQGQGRWLFGIVL